jgi:hypothetical protein
MIPGFPWFGPKTSFGWGWTPVTWQGWALTAGFIAGVAALSAWLPLPVRLPATSGLAIVFIIVVAATGTRPGGRWR